MAERVVIEVVGQTEGLEELDAKLASATQREKELIAQMDMLSKQKQQWQGSAQVVAQFDKEISSVNSELKATKKSIEDLSKAQKAMPGAVITENMNKSLKAQRVELMNAIASWSDWSESGKKAYDATIAKAGELDDKIRDLTGQIRFMGSDTAAFDAILQGTQLVAGGFSVATGVASLFGEKNEDLQQIMVKLQSVMAITIGLQQVGNALQKESNIMTGISVIQTKAKAAAEALATKGTIAATIAQKALNLVANANPYVLLATALITVVGAFYAFASGADAAKKAQDALNNSMGIADRDVDEIQYKYKILAETMRGAGKTQEEISAKQVEGLREESKKRNEIYNQVISNDKATSDQREKVGKDMIQAQQDLRLAEVKLEADKNEKIRKDNKDAAEKAKAASEKSAAEAKAAQEKRNAELLKANQDLQDAKIAEMKDGEDKEIAELKNILSRKLSEIKGNSQTEIALRTQLTENEAKEEEKVRKKYRIQAENLQRESDLNLINARLYMTKKGSNNERDIMIEAAKKQAEIDIATANQSTNTEEWKAAKIKEINSKLLYDIKNLNREYIKTADERAAGEVLATTQQYANGIILRQDYEDKIDAIRAKALQDEINERRKAGQDVTALLQQQADEHAKIIEKENEKIKEIVSKASEIVSKIGDIGNSLFAMQKNRLDAQTEEINHYYDTEIARAEGNATKQAQLEQQKAAKLLDIKRKQAKQDREQAIFNVMISSITAIAGTLAQKPIGIWNIILAATMAAATAVQIAAIRSQPLPKFWKGRKGGIGQFAMVGEQGAEIMWVPEGANIMPANDSRLALHGDKSKFDKWDMPRIESSFVAPSINNQLITQYNRTHSSGDRIDYDRIGKSIDYDRIGRSVAKHIKFPKQRDVSVNFDKKGLSVMEGNTTTNYLNSKYKL